MEKKLWHGVHERRKEDTYSQQGGSAQYPAWKRIQRVGDGRMGCSELSKIDFDGGECGYGLVACGER